MSKLRQRRILITILVLFVLLSTMYSVVVPPFEASDELWHYPMVKHIADNWSLPVQDPTNVGPWRQEGSQPPLYYFLTAVATSWIDTSDMQQVRHLNRHVDVGIATPDGNVNLVVHRPEQEAFPWEGTVLAVHLARFLSIAMATLGVALTYLVVRETFPRRPALALGATALHAFTPMVVFIAGSVNNDNLVVPLSSLTLLILLRMLRSPGTRSDTTWGQVAYRYLPLGFVLGLAALTKASSLALTVLTALVVTVRAVRRRCESPASAWQEFLIGGLATLLPLLAVAGWWYVRNIRLYGDPSGLSAFIEILGKREVPASIPQLWREHYSFLAGYWGNFGGLNVPMAPWVYQALNVTLAAAGAGLLLLLVQSLAHVHRAEGLETDNSDGAAPSPSAASCNLRFIICLLWGLGVLIPWVQWARITWSSQGRLIFAALPVWSLLLALGLTALIPGRWQTGLRRGTSLMIVLALFLLGLSASAPFVWIKPAYAHPEPLSDAQVSNIPRRTNLTFDNVMRLLGYGLETETAKPGGCVTVTLYWEAMAPTQQDHAIFVHLLDQHELIVAQRDTLPGLGLLSTTWLDPGQRWADQYVVPVPLTAYAPNQAQIEVGLFNTETAQRVPALDAGGQPAGDNARFGDVRIVRPPDDVPNPIKVNFGDRMLLSGYDLTQRAVQPSQTVTLTLYWEAIRAMETNYTVSAQLIDPSQRKAAQDDGWPQGGAAPTAAWQPGEVITDTIPLTVFPDASAGAYHVRIAVYVHEEGEIGHLPVTPPGGRMQTTHIKLTQVRVTP